MKADRNRTHAVLVGIGRYDIGDIWKLPDAPRYVVRFAEWLKDSGVPVTNIHVFLSSDNRAPLLASLDRLRVTDVRAATKSAFEDFFDQELDKLAAELLYFYWSGHGNIKASGERILFFEDWTDNLHHRHFDLDNALIRLRSEPYGTNLPQQIAYVDACANQFPFEGSTGANIGASKLSGVANKQLFFLAADSGQQALAGEFSKSVLKALELTQGESRSWPPDPDAVVEKVLPDFEASQRPVFISYTRKNGSKFQNETIDLPDTGFINDVEITRDVPVRHLRTLASVLVTYEPFANRDERERLHAALAGRVPAFTNRQAPLKRHDDLLEIVGKAFFWNLEEKLLEEVAKIVPAPASLEVELSRIRLLRATRSQLRTMFASGLTFERIRSTYQTTIATLSKAPKRQSASTLVEMLDELCVPISGDERYRSLYEFLLRLAAAFPDHRSTLENLVDSGQLAELKAMIEIKKRFFLQILVKKTIRSEAVYLRGLLFEAASLEQQLAWPEIEIGPGLEWKVIEENIRLFIEQAMDWVQLRTGVTDPSSLVIEFFVSSPFLLHKHESMLVRTVIDQSPLGVLHPVVVRWLDRHLYPMHAGGAAWTSQREVYAPLRSKKSNLSWIDDPAPPAPVSGLAALRFCPDVERLRKLLKRGLPFVTWTREKPLGGWDRFSGDLEAWAVQYDFDALPKQLFTARSVEIPPEFARTLTLLWDDPERELWKSSEVKT